MTSSLKYYLTLLMISICSVAQGQDINFVTATNGLIVRANPNKQAQRIGKLPYGSSVEIQTRTQTYLEVLDNGNSIQGEWVEVKCLEQDIPIQGYVFDGYLTKEELHRKFLIHFPHMKIEMPDIFPWDGIMSVNANTQDTVKISGDLASKVDGSVMRIIGFDYHKVEIFQRYETSITVMDEGPHCDLTEWRHYESPWQQLTQGGNEFPTSSYSEKEWERFIPIDMEELRLEVLTQCGERWHSLIKDVQNAHEYPLGIGISKIFFKLKLIDKTGKSEHKIIEFEIPMGC